jgi:LysM repeat protein
MGDPSAQQAAPAQTYKVERGDSLSAIARRFGVSVAEIKTANNLSTDTIKVGQELLIPGAGVAAASFVVEGETSEYVVATGDSLSVIARRFGVSVAAIKAANNLSGDTIRIGQKLVIPAAGQVVPSAAPAPAPKAPAPAISGQTYTVQEGETLGGIANRAGVKVQDLMAVNNITDPRKLRVGQVLQIPVGGRVPAAALAPSARLWPASRCRRRGPGPDTRRTGCNGPRIGRSRGPRNARRRACDADCARAGRRFGQRASVVCVRTYDPR